MDPLEISHTAPKFASSNPRQTAEWYRDHLNFPKIAIFENGNYAIVKRGQFALHFWLCQDRNIAENTSCYVELASVGALDTLHAEWLAASQLDGFAPGRIEADPKDQSGHGMREFHVWDPAGNLIGFGAAL